MSFKKNILLLGPPGCGKGTQSKMLSSVVGIPQIAMGDILRAAVRNETPLGKKAKEFMERGELVPDDVVVEIIQERLKESDCFGGFILDGFPRTVEQAKSLDEILYKLGKEISVVLSIDVPEEILVERLCGRRICPSCKQEYHVIYKKPKKDYVCDLCGAKLEQRSDDNEGTIKERLAVYKEKTEPLLDYYGKKGILRIVNGVGEIDEVFGRIQKAIE